MLSELHLPLRRQEKGAERLDGHMAVGQHQWYHFGVGAPPILEPILVGIGMFTGGDRAFDPWPHGKSCTATIVSDSRVNWNLKRWLNLCIQSGESRLIEP